MSDVVARTVRGFCQAYGVGVTTCYKLIAEGILDARKMSARKTLITEDSARAWVASLNPTHAPTHNFGAMPSEDWRRTAKKRRYHKSRAPKGKMANSATITNASGS